MKLRVEAKLLPLLGLKAPGQAAEAAAAAPTVNGTEAPAPKPGAITPNAKPQPAMSGSDRRR